MITQYFQYWIEFFEGRRFAMYYVFSRWDNKNRKIPKEGIGY